MPIYPYIKKSRHFLRLEIQTLAKLGETLKLNPPITRIHFGFSFHIQIISLTEIYIIKKELINLHRDREGSSFFPESYARRAARALSLKLYKRVLAVYNTHENNKLKDSGNNFILLEISYSAHRVSFLPQKIDLLRMKILIIETD